MIDSLALLNSNFPGICPGHYLCIPHGKCCSVRVASIHDRLNRDRTTGIYPLPSDDVRLSLEQSSKRSRARLRLLTCELALRQYRLEHGSEPAKLADLVPDYLPELPIDPFSGRPLRYQPDPTGHRLYSVWPDGVDDGGKAIQEQLASEIWPGDLLLVEPAAEAPKP